MQRLHQEQPGRHQRQQHGQRREAAGQAPLLRLLTGPRWRLGPRDLAALGRRARSLVRGTAALPDDPVEAVVLGVDESQVGSLVDALDDLPPAADGTVTLPRTVQP